MFFNKKIKDNRDVYRVFFKYLLWTVLFLCLILMIMWQNIHVADLEYKVRKLEKEMLTVSQENKKLQTEFSFLSSPERIGNISKKMGLVPVREEDIIWIASNEK
ncbi:MAG: hypothetical protein JW827_03970 [Spirochaetes bacterium]|nr:hypothetical protein [Spirochaetota bacterium]